ncbi:MAG: hypothetical protein K6B41_02770 [Butyrivibrio sp.]|nr:hypothetical protein [Butyrivibrio sp.]
MASLNENLRKDLVSQLAQSMGFNGESKKDPSHYDPTTGTVYCNGTVYTKADIEKARLYCLEAAKKYAGYGDSAAGMMEIAAIAIEELQKNNIKSGGNVVIKDENTQ